MIKVIDSLKKDIQMLKHKKQNTNKINEKWQREINGQK